MQTVNQMYIEGIKDARKVFELEGLEFAHDHIANLKSTIKGFSKGSPVGEMLKGELDFWKKKQLNLAVENSVYAAQSQSASDAIY